MNFEAIVVVIIIPAFGSVVGGLLFLWREHNKLQAAILAEREARIKDLEEKHSGVLGKLSEMSNRLHKQELDYQKLQNQITLLQSSHDHSPLPTWMKDLDGKMLFINAAYEDIFLRPLGLTAADYIGNTDTDVWPEHIAKRFIEHDQEIHRTLKLGDFIENIPDSSGTEIPCRIVKFPRYSNGKRGILIGIGGVAIPEHFHAWGTKA